MNKYLWKFCWEYGRRGNVEGLFIATEDEVRNSLGKEAYFGEILGKHSEVYGILEECDFEKVEIEFEAIERLASYLGDTWCGYNPLDYVNSEERSEEDDE